MGKNKTRYNGSHEFIVTKRRMLVEQALFKGCTIRQAAVVLEESGLINPETGKPYTTTTIHSDKKALEEQWRKNAEQSIEERKARILAEIQDIKTMARRKEELRTALAAIKRECKVCGIDAPKQHDVFGFGGDFNLTIKRREQKEKDAGE